MEIFNGCNSTGLFLRYLNSIKNDNLLSLDFMSRIKIHH